MKIILAFFVIISIALITVFTSCEKEEKSPFIPVTNVTLDKTILNLFIDSTEILSASLLPENATTQNITWLSSDTTIATVNNGIVKALKAGKARITATAGYKLARCLVKVVPNKIAVTDITLNKTHLPLMVGDNEKLIATVLPENAEHKAVTWSSSNQEVVTVSATGKVTALAADTATITATTVDGGKTATCNITITAPNIPVNSVTLNKTNLPLTIGDKDTLHATILPINATNKAVTWGSSNQNIATISTTGEIIAMATGLATITATTIDGNKTATCAVTVTAPNIPVNSITLNKTSLPVTVGDRETLSATVLPTNATNQAITWSSSNTNVATVSTTGEITAIAAGAATITVKTTDGNKTATCAVTVTAPNIPVNSITLNKTSLPVTVGDRETLSATVLPTNATNQAITWSSSNTNVATISTTGEITAIAAGAATITVKTTDGNKTATCAVTVTASTIPVNSVTLNKTSLPVNVGDRETLSATVLPTNATNQDITWSSSNTNVATVSTTGEIAAIAVGSATITVTTVDGNKTAICAITVTASTVAVSSVRFLETNLQLAVGNEKIHHATVLPTNATNKAVNYSSSNTDIATVTATGGKITAIAAGSAIITVTTVDGRKTATCTVTVTAPTIAVSSVSLYPNNLSLNIDETRTLTATVLPANATNKMVNYSSSNTNIATVSATGEVRAVAAGSATITVTTVDGNKTEDCVVTVIGQTIPVSGVTLNKTNLSLIIEESETLIASVLPANATNQTVTYSSNNLPVATVSATTGKITAMGAGTARITATTVDGNKTATCDVSVSRVGNHAYVGDFYYSDGTYSSFMPGKTCIGIVFWVDPGNPAKGKIISVDEPEPQWEGEESSPSGGLPFSNEHVFANATSATDGAANTEKIKNLSSYSLHNYPSFAWCISKGNGWYLPAHDEVVALAEVQARVQLSLNRVSLSTQLGSNTYYCTSTEHNKDANYFIILRQGNTAGSPSGKGNFGKIRAVYAF